MSESEGEGEGDNSSVDTDTLERRATAESDGGERYTTLSANKSGEVTADDEE